MRLISNRFISTLETTDVSLADNYIVFLPHNGSSQHAKFDKVATAKTIFAQFRQAVIADEPFFDFTIWEK